MQLLKMEREMPPVIRELSDTLASDASLSTQSIAFALAAIARATKAEGAQWGVSYRIDGGGKLRALTTRPLMQRSLPTESHGILVENNSENRIWAALADRRIPSRGEEKDLAQGGLRLSVDFVDGEDDEVDVEHLVQGEDFRAVITVSAGRRRLENVALSFPTASGWEIRSLDADGKLSFQDVRDARVDLFFDLEAGGSLEIEIGLTASFKGRYYLPMTRAEAMYDPSIAARQAGMWVEVVEP